MWGIVNDPWDSKFEKEESDLYDAGKSTELWYARESKGILLLLWGLILL